MALVLTCPEHSRLASMSNAHPEVQAAGTPVPSGVDALGLCPYSEETLNGCRHYHPIAEHGDFPEAGHCRDALLISGADHIRHTICARRR